MQPRYALFRTDASLRIGTGHVMRCLTLADALSEQGFDCRFICREHPGNLISHVAERGYTVYPLPCEPASESNHSKEEGRRKHADWLGVEQESDASLCLEIVRSLQPGWLIIDHYALDIRWEDLLRPYCGKLMVIDDLADRPHNCDLLIDQTYGRSPLDYALHVSEHSELLCGAEYALLKPEFRQWREYSLKRRENGKLHHLLINLGGVDKDNITTRILDALNASPLPSRCRITVVMGATAPCIDAVIEQASKLSWPTEVKVGVNNMAELMANSDLAIGAAGTTSWERCCLGLPSILVVLADNQRKIATELESHYAARCISSLRYIDKELPNAIQQLINAPEILKDLSHASRLITTGKGATHIMRKMNHVENR